MRSTATRLNRILQILSLLDARRARRMTVEDLSALLNVNRRTIFRDIKTLRQAGVTVDWDPVTETYSSPQELDLPRKLSDDEQSALLVGVALVESGVCGPDLAGNAAVAHQKLLEGVSSSATERAQRIVHAVGIDAQRPDDGPNVWLHDILESVSDTRCLRIHLKLEGAGDAPSILFQPHLAVWTGGQCVLLGRSSWHRGNIGLPLKLVARVEVLEETFERPRQVRRRNYPLLESRGDESTTTLDASAVDTTDSQDSFELDDAPTAAPHPSL
jgi:biotin operon repressor